MANLNYNEITRDGKEYRAELIVDKTFKLNDKSNNFVTDDGLLVAEYLKLNNETVKNIRDSEKAHEVVSRILGMKVLKPNQRKVFVVGKLQGQNTRKEYPLNKLQKSEEFGGQPAGGTRVNKGIQFEHDFVDVSNKILSGQKYDGKYARQITKIMERTAKEVGSPVVKVEPVGGMNQPRPLAESSGQMYIEPAQHYKHGEKLTDINYIHANGKKSYLSLKYSSTLTFMNAGVVQALPAKEIKEGTIKNPLGKQILETFSIDNDIFCDVFNKYGKGTKFPTVKTRINATKLKKFLQTCIGSNYWMVHGMDGGKIYFWEMSRERNPMFASVSGNVEIQYGGKQGRGKRIDIVFSNRYFDFKVNIRNKQGGLYPSHIMCDYTSKPATGKELL